MSTTLRISLPRLLALGLAAMLTGCATTQMTAEWRDPTFAAGSLKSRRVLVVCRAPEETLRRVCEDQWATQLGAQGIALMRSYSIPGFPWASGDTSEEMKAALRANGIEALASMSLIPSAVVVTSGPEIGFGIGGGSGGGHRGGGVSFGGIGVSLPVGGATTTQGFDASSSLVDAASGKLVWSGSASAPASGDIVGQVGALTQVTVEAMRRAGML